MERTKGPSAASHADTSNQAPEDEGDTSCHMGNENPFGAYPVGYNRKVHRYAKKHGVPLDKAFAAIYGGKGR